MNPNYLDFEQPIADLESKIKDLRSASAGPAVNVDAEVKALEDKLGDAETVKAIWKAQNTVPVDEEKAQSLMKLIDTLEDDDDVQNVYSNFEVSDEVMARLSA